MNFQNINFKDILSIKITDNWELSILINLVVLLSICFIISIFVAFIFYFKKSKWVKDWNVEKVEINIPFGSGKVEIKADQDTKRIAHQAWAEIITRKAGMKFDVEDDVIIEIYNSWYELFKEIRSLIKTIPARKIKKSEDVQKLVEVLTQVLNNGLRPHLTKWQARFRRWYESELEKRKDISIQDVQKNYPKYNDLVKDLEKVNEKMVEFASELRKIIDS